MTAEPLDPNAEALPAVSARGEAAEQSPVAPPTPERLEAGAAATANAYVVQLASLRSAAEAESTWARLSSEQQDLFAETPHRVVRADLGERGTFFRLRVGPFENQAEAGRLCEQLAARDVDCLLWTTEAGTTAKF